MLLTEVAKMPLVEGAQYAITEWDLVDLGFFKTCELVEEMEDLKGLDIRVHVADSIDDHRGVNVASIWLEDKFAAVAVFAGRAKDGGKFYIHDIDAYSQIVGLYASTIAKQNESVSLSIDKSVNGYEVFVR
jgi:hypothetical protein